MRFYPKPKSELNNGLWFAWYPVKTKCGVIVWLEKVNRYQVIGKFTSSDGCGERKIWQYKLLEK